MAKYDLPAVVDEVLSLTGAATLSYVGHSQGSLIGFVAFSSNRALAAKVMRIAIKAKNLAMPEPGALAGLVFALLGFALSCVAVVTGDEGLSICLSLIVFPNDSYFECRNWHSDSSIASSLALVAVFMMCLKPACLALVAMLALMGKKAISNRAVCLMTASKCSKA